MLQSLFHPTSVCIVGASADPSRLAGRPLDRLVRHHFPGGIYLVNPGHEEIGGYRCFPSVTSLPQAVDVALVAVPADAVPAVVEQCGVRGISNVVVLSSGFEEDSTGGNLVAQLRDAVRRSGVRLVGPNCEGIWSIPAKLALTFGSAADRGAFLPGTVSVVSQSGSIGGACMRELQDRQVGCRYFVSTGNETDLTAMDFCEYLVEEGSSRVIAMFLEGVRDGERLPGIVVRARKRGIALIALRAGSSDLGKLAMKSHTGRIATAAGVYRDVFHQHGILEVSTFGELIKAIEIAQMPQPCVKPQYEVDGDAGVGVIAMSGGSRALLADSCDRRGVPLANFSNETVRKLADILPRFGHARNPADVTGQILSDPAMFAQVADIVARDPHTDTLLVQYANGAERQITANIDLFAELVTTTGKPVVASLLGGSDPQIPRRLSERGIIHAADPDEAILYLSWHSRLHRELSVRDVAAPVRRPVGSARLADWASRMRFLEGAGIKVPGWAIVAPEDEAIAVMSGANLRFPLVAKALPETSEHKTDRGLIALDVRDREELEMTLGRLRGAIGERAPILLQQMAGGGVEVLLAVRHDRDFGPLLTIGSGGPLTEWLSDVCHVQLPAGPDDMARALRRLKLWDLLQPFRGRRQCDVDALLTAAFRLAEAYMTGLPEGWEIELNPLMVYEEGREPLALDVLCVPPVAQGLPR